MSLYPVVPGVRDGFAEGGLVIAVRLEDVASPLRDGAPVASCGGPALVVGGTERIRSGDAAVFCTVVAVAPAVVRRDVKVQAAGSPAGHATLGPLEDWLGRWAGPGVIDDVAGRAVLDRRFVKGERERLLTRGLMIRAILLMTLVPESGIRDAVTALAGDLAMVPWSRPWQAPSERAIGDWRSALGPGPLEELRDIVLEASRGRATWQSAALRSRGEEPSGTGNGTGGLSLRSARRTGVPGGSSPEGSCGGVGQDGAVSCAVQSSAPWRPRAGTGELPCGGMASRPATAGL